MSMRDRFGLGWREPLAAGLLAHLERVDVLEVVAEDWLYRSRVEWSALRRLARAVPLHVHGVSLGLASTVLVGNARAEAERLERLAELVGFVEPEAWSEHLAFVRGGGLEIGHLAAPPRCAATLEGLAENVARARTVIGSAPLLENVATLIDPPLSTWDELSWTQGVLDEVRSPLLLDLHNLHANAANFGFDAQAFLAALPLDRVGAVHLAGGRQAARLIDDHLHPVPDAVFALLTTLAARSPAPLTVLIERDGAFEGVEPLLGELDRARAAVAEGRAARVLALR